MRNDTSSPTLALAMLAALSWHTGISNLHELHHAVAHVLGDTGRSMLIWAQAQLLDAAPGLADLA